MQAGITDDPERGRLERVATNRMGLWWALALEILGLLAFVLLFNFLLPTLGDTLSTPARIGLGLIFSLVPAALWLLFFYGFDRVEPEPKGMVLTVFLLGGLLFAALHGPLLQGLFGVDNWLSTSWWSRLLGGFLVVGVVEQALVWLTVRVSVYDHPEFDERVDGVIYAVAAGLGMATVINFSYVLERGGVNLDIGSVRMVVNALAYASFAGVLGYFMGQVRFEKTPWYYLPLGLALAALLNGLLFYWLDSGSTGLAGEKPWGDLLLASVVAVLALVMVFWLIARANEETLRVLRGEARPEKPRRDLPEAPEAPARIYGGAPAFATAAPAPATEMEAKMEAEPDGGIVDIEAPPEHPAAGTGADAAAEPDNDTADNSSKGLG